MISSFFLLVAASVILWYLALQSKAAFDARVRARLPRTVLKAHLTVVFRQFPDQLPAFRTQALPLQARHLALNAFACATFLGGLWWCPPAFLAGADLSILRYSGLTVVAAAFLVDVLLFCRMAYAAWVPASLPSGEDAGPDA